MNLTTSRFARLADEALGDLLAEHGFEPTSAENIGRSWFRTYRKGDCYVRVSVSERWRDEEPHCQVLLGEGPDSWPEVDWNAVGLRMLAGDPGCYPLSAVTEAEVTEALARIHRNLEGYASDFLRGRMERFREIRATQNADRQPYLIYEPDEDGNYRAMVDPESAELKARYTRGAG